MANGVLDCHSHRGITSCSVLHGTISPNTRAHKHTYKDGLFTVYYSWKTHTKTSRMCARDSRNSHHHGNYQNQRSPPLQQQRSTVAVMKNGHKPNPPTPLSSVAFSGDFRSVPSSRWREKRKYEIKNTNTFLLVPLVLEIFGAPGKCTVHTLPPMEVAATGSSPHTQSLSHSHFVGIVSRQHGVVAQRNVSCILMLLLLLLLLHLFTGGLLGLLVCVTLST